MILNPSVVFRKIEESHRLILLILLALSVGFLGALFAPPEYAVPVALLPIIGLIGLQMALKPEVILVLTIVIIPIENADWLNAPFPGSLTASKLLGMALIGAFIFHVIFYRMKFRIFDDNHDYIIFAFCGVMFFSGIISPQLDAVLGEVDRVARLVLFYVVIKNLVQSPKIMLAIMLGVFVASIYASLNGINDYLFVTNEWGKRVRASGINENPNNFAMASVIAFVIGWHFFSALKKVWQRVLVFVGLVVLVIGIILSGSRGGLLSFLFVLLMMILTHPRRKQLIVIAAVTMVLAFPFFPESIKSRMFPFLGSSDFSNAYEESAANSTARRLGYYQFGLQLIAHRPIQGMGYRSFRTLYPRSEFARFDNPVEERNRDRVAHNVYLETGTGLGFSGLFVFIGILFTIWRGGHQAGNNSERGSISWATGRSVEFAIIAFSISSVFISSEQEKHLWYLAGMSSAALHYATVKSKHMYDQARKLPTG